MTVKLILLTDVSDLGKKGDMVDVSDGYARNYLIPKKRAMKATAGALSQADKLRTARLAADKEAREAAERIATQLAGTRVVLAAQAGDEGKLYGSIGAPDIVEGIKRFTGVDVDRRTLDIRTPIKAIGLHEVWLKLHPMVEFPITLDVIPA
jgi:large subunit ribosomal protein L9